MAKMTVEPEKVERLKADKSGRVSIGPEYAGKRVMVIVEGEVGEDG